MRRTPYSRTLIRMQHFCWAMAVVVIVVGLLVGDVWGQLGSVNHFLILGILLGLIDSVKKLEAKHGDWR